MVSCILARTICINTSEKTASKKKSNERCHTEAHQTCSSGSTWSSRPSWIAGTDTFTQVTFVSDNLRECGLTSDLCTILLNVKWWIVPRAIDLMHHNWLMHFILLRAFSVDAPSIWNSLPLDDGDDDCYL